MEFFSFICYIEIMILYYPKELSDKEIEDIIKSHNLIVQVVDRKSYETIIKGEVKEDE